MTPELREFLIAFEYLMVRHYHPVEFQRMILGTWPWPDTCKAKEAI